MIKIYIPYNNNKQCIYREQAFSAIYNYYSSIEDFDVKILSSTPFSRASARNSVFEDKLEDTDTIFFSDADIITPEDQIRSAVKKSSETDEMILAYSLLSKMNYEETCAFVSKRKLVKSRKMIKFQCSGSFAITTTLLKEVGGYDERFTEWGCEDRVFFYLAAFLRNKSYCERLPGIAYHLFHPRSKNAGRRFLAENDLHREYLQAFGISIDSLKKYKKTDVRKIKKLMKESEEFKNKSKKEIIPFNASKVVKFRKNRKIILVLKDSEKYKKLLNSKEFQYEGVAA
jgi:predicted glycosyltransferase involved in capsule biosynthesis